MGYKMGHAILRAQPEGGNAAVEERQRDFRKEVEAAETPAGAEGAGRVPLKGAVSAADWG